MSLTEGPIVRSLLRVALPAAAFQLLVFANNLVDYFWIQMLGEEAASGQTAGWTVFWMLASLGQIFSTGTTAIVARRVGSGDHDAARQATSHALRGAFLAALVVGVIGWLLVPLLVEINESTPRAAKYTVDYLLTLCAGAPIIFLFYAIEGAFKGRGDMRRPLMALATALVINIVLDPVLIHVLGLEVLGAALATLAAFTITGALLYWAAVRRRWVGWVAGLDLAIVRNVVRIGLPVSMHGIVFSSVYIFIVRETNLAGGDAATAALGLGLRVEGFAYMVSVGFATAAAAMVGQNLGAGRPDRTSQAVRTASGFGLMLAAVIGSAFLLIPDALLGLFGMEDPVVRELSIELLRYLAVSGLFITVALAYTGGLQGTGDTKSPMYISFISQIFIPLGMCFLIQTFSTLDPADIWMAIVIGHVTRAVLSVTVFRWERWRDIKVAVSSSEA